MARILVVRLLSMCFTRVHDAGHVGRCEQRCQRGDRFFVQPRQRGLQLQCRFRQGLGDGWGR